MSSIKTEGYIVPFMLDNGVVRGRLVRLGTALTDITNQHNYPAIINQYIGEMLALGAALIMDIKTQGLITLQITNAAIVNMIVADVNSDGDIRACASWNNDALMALIKDTPKPSFAQLFAGGNLTFTVALAHQKEHYQAIVELNGATLSECMHHYFRQSAQIPTALFIGVEDSAHPNLARDPMDLSHMDFSAAGTAAGTVIPLYSATHQHTNQPNDDHKDYVSGAILLQRTPIDPTKSSEEIEAEEDDWFTGVSLLATLKVHELLAINLAPDQLLHRLFHERSLKITTFKNIQARCTCSRARIHEILTRFSADDIEGMFVNDKIEVDCEFCSKKYVFEKPDINSMLMGEKINPMGE